MIPMDLRLALASLGESGVPDIPPMLENRQTAWNLIMCGDEPWRQLGAHVIDSELRSIIRGLILFSQASGWSGGSVSPVIVLYREFLSRIPADEEELTSWIVQRRRNDYEPFGTIMHGGARTQAEFLEHQRFRARRREEGLARDRKRQEAEASAKAQRATGLVAAAVKRGDVAGLKGLIAAGADLSKVELHGNSLIDIAREHEREAMIVFLHSLSPSQSPS